jgi:hypothetical protein
MALIMIWRTLPPRNLKSKIASQNPDVFRAAGGATESREEDDEYDEAAREARKKEEAKKNAEVASSTSKGAIWKQGGRTTNSICVFTAILWLGERVSQGHNSPISKWIALA